MIDNIQPRSGYVKLPKKATKANSFEDIKKAKRLFYQELHKFTKPTGRWIEIYDVQEFVKDEEEHQRLNIKNNCLQKSYLDHHNFHVVL